MDWRRLRIDGKSAAAKFRCVPKAKHVFPLRHPHKLCEGLRLLAAEKSGDAEGNRRRVGAFRGHRELLGTGRTLSHRGTFSSFGQLYRRAAMQTFLRVGGQMRAGGMSTGPAQTRAAGSSFAKNGRLINRRCSPHLATRLAMEAVIVSSGIKLKDNSHNVVFTV